MSRGPWKNKKTNNLSNDTKQALKRAVIKAQLDKPKRKSKKDKIIVDSVVKKQDVINETNVKNAIKDLDDDVSSISSKKVRRRRKTIEDKKAKSDDKEDQKKVTIEHKIKKLPNGDELFKFAGYSVVKVDERNLMLKFKDLFLGYYSSNKLSDLLTTIGIKLLSSKPSNETNQAINDINSLTMSLDKFQKFLRGEFLCQNPQL